jgi:Zn-dependent protease
MVPARLNGCPACGALVHAGELQRLAAEAEAAEGRGELTLALERWNQASMLLPADAPQLAAIAERIGRLNDLVLSGAPGSGNAAGAPTSNALAKGGGAIAAVLALAFKFKSVLFVVFTKFKIVLLGLTKLKTLLSMFAFFGVYWARWGWKFALGFVLTIYIHEMGHIVSLRRFGIKASAPMFIPFIGAFILVEKRVRDVRVDARTGLAGPLWGLYAALGCAGLYFLTRHELFAALATFTAWMNLFNLIPVWQLDGAWGMSTLTRRERIVLVAVLALAAAWLRTPMLAIVALVAAAVTIFMKPSERSDRPMLALFALLALAHAGIAAVGHETMVQIGAALPRLR